MEKRWRIRRVNEAHLRRLMRELSLPSAAARILLNRGITTPEDGKRFLEPSLRSLDGLFDLPGIHGAVSLVERAIRQGSQILIFGDYDVDGLTGSAILARFLRRFNESVEVYVPSRFLEGYGLTKEAVDRIVARKQSSLLVIAVDCGIRDTEGARILKAHGAGLIVLDHHFPDPLHYPEADAIVSTWDFGGNRVSLLSGAGLALLFVRALALHLGVTRDPAEEYLDLACLGTVGDAVPLLGENRVIAKYGLEILNRNPSLPVRALCEASGIGGRPVSADSVGFILAPRINAAGRVDHPKVALDLLLCDHPEEALVHARRLNALNSKRQEEEERVFRDILTDPEKQVFLEDAIVVLSGKGWNIGVLGIVASRLSERLLRPVIVLGEVGEVAVGSGRSVEGFNLLEALKECSSLLVRYGGHEMAAGVKIRTEHIPLFRKRLNELFARRICEISLSQGLVVDAVVGLRDIDGRFLSFWEKLKPFGEKNPNPLLATLNVVLERRWAWGRKGNHLRLLLRQGKEYQEAVVFEGSGRMEELCGSSLADFAFEVHNGGEDAFYLKVHDWRIKK
ncbi:MAG: single-stranded-DNA-specific exonuclease RecJ [Candidatus Caldatribacterium sp.]|nr:single-stranded-DNA-specific exonuclease RecJ [Candidatus Caldatribacterium sp.]